MKNIQKDNPSTISTYLNDHIFFIFIFQYYIQKMNEIEEIVRDRIVIELESLKRELVKEAKQRRKEGEIIEDMYLKYKLFHETDGIIDAVKKINKRIQEKSMS